ncbi:MAG: arsenate reductase ArsC [Actinobacteria bacterium]|nr:arsenate reductase ArsC [Actinomycetota bacterium]
MTDTKSYLDDVAPESRHLISHAAQRLLREFGGIFGPETIERFVAESCAQFGRARIQAFVPLFVERFSRERLRALAKMEGQLTSDAPSVVFLCVHNAGRSQMAAGWMQHLAGTRLEVFSGGSDPASDVNPAAVEAMAEVGIDISREFPKPWTDEILRVADVIVTMGCGDACPIYPGKRYEDWELADPAGRPVEEVRVIRDDIKARVEHLLEELTPRR